MRLICWLGGQESPAHVKHYPEGGAVGLQGDRINFSSIHYRRRIIHPISVSAIVENQKIARGIIETFS